MLEAHRKEQKAAAEATELAKKNSKLLTMLLQRNIKTLTGVTYASDSLVGVFLVKKTQSKEALEVLQETITAQNVGIIYCH